MNEIDEILSNIDKDDQDNPAHSPDLNAGISAPEEAPGGEEKESAPADDAAASEIQVDDLPEVQITLPSGRPETSIPGGGEKFSAKGTKTWNTREPYIIKIAAETLRKDLADLQRSFYYVDEPAGIEALKEKIKQEIVKFLRKPTDNITDRYADFIYRSIIAVTQEISSSFALDQENEKLFVYHIGPLTIYKILKEEFILKKYGFCYAYLPGNKAARFFPAEFVKEIILKWNTENINMLELPFDSIQKYEEIKNLVMKKYQNDLRIFNTRFDQLNAKIDPAKSISRSRLFQLKGSEWFGILSIEIYKRFMGNSIFI